MLGYNRNNIKNETFKKKKKRFRTPWDPKTFLRSSNYFKHWFQRTDESMIERQLALNSFFCDGAASVSDDSQTSIPFGYCSFLTLTVIFVLGVILHHFYNIFIISCCNNTEAANSIVIKFAKFIKTYFFIQNIIAK